ncbi:MerR family transcriptional regulator [Lactiplantibacillus mudanjiangensis]|uniref:MerR family transcriptional regulator [Lactobacillus brevis] n=1 Tax=Lactiplantibacillus mudanjiangensis TaxID=1296538 RepID=A0A660E1E4_9LACO|nr:MerR family transcriptional regulator [Lactiplantibacillus mudanjiangensis]VDG17734.1 MerR family transcriptional regulator [Lactobacillus brevis] [Lactiplantibacillus mudanjiangensis]VDG25129.1 MerR family transcriptional regulator [Lactobacillus brevis] [Lactiplantibacillus mudanjiangensis]VDG29462.1 MerR family transcriptional regulator [Lactobacillus brevis] [Lactiplantibacillus mudanjiangensis]VDG32575.1 MerR family transcriptional regulator [Lactobacillus brevis] [Lactiplantibacillus m
MTYTIKEVAAKTGLSIYTLRYYDQAGLLPFVSRNTAGYREFTDGDLQLIHTITCLKTTGMPLAKIRQYMTEVMQGPATIPQRQQLLSEHRQAVLAQQAQIQQSLQELDLKLAIYQHPAAVTFVNAELSAIQAEKVANGLPNPFKK